MKALLSLFFLVSGSAFGVPLSPVEYMDKISQRLTGGWSLPEEQDQLEEEMRRTGCRENSCLQDFFRAYVQKKLDTPEFYSEAVAKVFEKFGFQMLGEIPFPMTSMTNLNLLDAREILLPYRVFKDDLPIDSLYTEQQFFVRGLDSSSFDQSILFSIQTPVPAPQCIVLSSRYPELIGFNVTELNYSNHPNVSGLFSTLQFVQRYWNSPANAGRKRAAAFYRIMLCNSMNPAIERDSMKDREEALARGIPEMETTTRSIEEIHRNRHAHQADCAKCHNLLDPVAYTMRPLELGISKFPSSGMLRLYNGFNQTEEYRVNNFAELVRKATELQAYQDCQMNWLFNWIIGKDVNVHPGRFMELLDGFKANARKARTMVRELVLTPEFRGETAPFVEDPAFTRANAVFSNCRECHTNFFNTNASELKVKLVKIALKLDLAHDGLNRQMPPADHWWAPTAGDLQAVKNWIQIGAPLSQGRAILTPGEVRQMLNPQGAR